MTREQQVKPTVAGARRVKDGYTKERVLLPNGRTMERILHEESGTTGDWTLTKEPFTVPSPWIRQHEAGGWEITKRPVKWTLGRLLLHALMVIGALAAFWILLYVILAVFVVLLMVFGFSGRPYRYRRSYRRW